MVVGAGLEKGPIIDIAVTTCDRIELLQRTLGHIWARTRTPHRIQVLDDGSQDGTPQYITALQTEGKIAGAWLRQWRSGIPAQLGALLQITESDPLVFTDDDVLCPDLEPDWLARGLALMEEYPKLGLLALNSPQCNINGKRGPKELSPGFQVTYCRNIPGTFVFVRRAALASILPPDGTPSPVHQMCLTAAERGWKVGYMTRVYCQHIGTVSVRNKKNMVKELEKVQPVNPTTLEPPEAYRG